ncbi:hypothetical protein [Kitasatospora sp. NPDC051914]|uniref:hypothetical protein n=1 Tax=Kitasatospora sp. NPDC051914 TaxID=3154945 RepID=UPI0034158278
MNEEIERRLREAAEAHRPDRARMLARVERGMAGPAVRHRARPFARSGIRVALAGLAAGGILTTGGLAVAAIVAEPSPPPTVATPTTLAPAVSSPPPTSARPTPVAPPATTPGSSRPTPSATSASPSPTVGESQNGPLWSAGSLDPYSSVYWTQSDLFLKTTQPLTSLTVEIRIVQTGKVKNAGTWHTLPSGDFTVTVQEAGGALVYRWVLKPGLTVPAGSYRFGAQFNNGSVRSAAGDGYRVDAQASGGSASVRGGFVPTR